MAGDSSQALARELQQLALQWGADLDDEVGSWQLAVLRIGGGLTWTMRQAAHTRRIF